MTTSFIAFKVGPGITWWKSIQVRLIGSEGQETQDWVTNGIPFFLYQNLLPDQSQAVGVEFWKGKFLGIHTYVGEAKITWDSIKGKSVYFTWEND